MLLYYISLRDLLGVYRVVILVILSYIAPTTAELEHLLYLLTEREKNRKWKASNENTEQVASSLEILKNFTHSKLNSLLLPPFQEHTHMHANI